MLQQTLHAVVFCTLPSQLSEFLFRAAIYWFSHAIVTCMLPFDHVPYAAWGSNWLMLRGYPASLLTILGAPNQPSQCQQITTEGLGIVQYTAQCMLHTSEGASTPRFKHTKAIEVCNGISYNLHV